MRHHLFYLGVGASISVMDITFYLILAMLLIFVVRLFIPRLRKYNVFFHTFFFLALIANLVRIIFKL